MELTIGMITLDSTDPVSIGRWWAEQFDAKILTENDGFFVVLSLGDGVPRFAFQKVDDPTPGKNRLHPDLIAPDREAAVDRLTAAGATLVGRNEYDGFPWVVLADPDGNQFCVAAGE